MNESIKRKIAAYLLRLLSLKEYSTKDVRAKLTTKFKGDGELIEEVISEFKDANYLSDERYAKMIIRHYVNNLYGPKRVYIECLKREIAKESLNNYLLEEEVNWQENAYELVQRRFSKELMVDKEQRRKVLAFLVRRGFLLDDAIGALRRFRQGTEE